MPLRAPFPYFGGKSRAADFIWERLGDVPNYVEPFAGSFAVLLARPHAPRIETVNDANAHLCNFWRAIQHDPAEVARWADWPVNEADLHARHLWLVNAGADRVERLKSDPNYYDVQAAGWWVWGLCCWIGSGWCSAAGPRWAQRPHLSHAGQGVYRSRLDDLLAYFAALSHRLRRVRVCCGDWTRVLGPAVTYANSNHDTITGILLDPPYAPTERVSDLYTVETNVSAAVRHWAIANGDNPLLRIALCGYDGEHDVPPDWTCVTWKANGGYGAQGDNAARQNSHRERVWFSPHCRTPEQPITLFEWAEQAVMEQGVPR